MTPIDAPGDIRPLVLNTLADHGPDLTDLTRHQIVNAVLADDHVLAAIGVVEAVYAVRDTVPPPWKEVAAALADIVVRHQWFGWGKIDGRGRPVLNALLRDLGTPSDTDLGPSADPAADPDYLPPVPVEDDGV